MQLLGWSLLKQKIFSNSVYKKATLLKMSFYTITMLVRWAVTEDKERIDELANIPYKNRHRDPQIIGIIQYLRDKWARGTKIERISVLGWDERECCQLLSDLLENLPKLRQEYEHEVQQHGTPPELDDKDFDKFTNAAIEEKEAMRKK